MSEPLAYLTPPTRWLKASVLAGAAAIVLVMWGFVGFSALSARRTAIEDARLESANLAAAFNNEIALRLDTLAATMNVIAGEMRAQNGTFDLYRWAKTNPVINGYPTQGVIIGPDGHVVSSADEPNPAPIDLGDREHFRVHLDGAYHGLYIGRPVLSRTLAQPDVILPTSMRVNAADGRFLGVIVLLAPNLSSIFDSVDVGPSGVVSLLGFDDIIRARFSQMPAGANGVGERGKGFGRQAIGPDGIGWAVKKSPDDVTRLYSYRRVRQYPLILEVGLDLDHQLAAERSNEKTLIGLAAAATLIMGTLIFYLVREIDRRAVRAIDLRNTNLQLAESERRADEANRAKSLFLANMSHELRTPLNAVIGFSQIIKDETFGPTARDRYREYAGDILNAGQHLLDLITAVLDISKIEAKKFVLHEEVIDVNAVARASMATLSFEAEKRSIILRLNQSPFPLSIRADPLRMRQILTNLLSNAIKFSRENGVVSLGIAIDPIAGIIVTVTDHGIGMTAAEIFIAFEPFSQVDNALNKEYAGTGLGLPIAKALAELHGGALGLRSIRNVGTIVTVTLPSDRIITGTGFQPLRAA
jgi:signal transduction histidine kinase